MEAGHGIGICYHFAQQNLTSCSFSFLRIGVLDNWMFIMPFYMATWLKTFSWNNYLDLLILSILLMSASWISLSTTLNNHPRLGLEVHRTLIGIHLSQAKYITDLLTRAAMLDAKPCPTPMSSNTNLSLHDGAVKRILRYLKGTSHFGLFLQPSLHSNITCYTDADWASCTSGYYLFLGSNLVSWSSSKQKVVSRSNTELEY
ncbi:Retrovirus-related Pol polyprotein from transposon RE1 [Vitis vinifera]|uniref:Retrovirus-related Pol polyprotein from transposon RE1 n=1 Tax=Vitis vinifera TaxID=29760 RepID=A0A438JBN5_VITVI|nr:Retrovirus-related Pol polyprotein from transposon RE1 [Vitis vinifera]